jgi:Skp family chaperone for outer membrane proteins
MRRFPLVLLALVVGAAPALAADDAPGLKIATFDLGRVEKASQRKLDGMAAIEARFAERKKDFETRQARLRNMMQDLRGSVFRPGSPEHREMTVRAQNLEREVKRLGVALTRDIGEAKSRLLRDLYEDLERAIAHLVEAEGYDLVFQLQKPSPTLPAPEMARQLNAMALFHAHPRFDVTDRLVEAMNASYAAEKKEK